MKMRSRNWKNIGCVAGMFALVAFAGVASAASTGGVFSTDRFGYTGTVVHYGSLADAQSETGALDTVVIGDSGVSGDGFEHRDASFYVVDNAAAYDTDYNILMGSWWYTINGSAGHGNINGNTGIGFMQLYDDDGSTDSSLSMDFSNFNGTHWTDFTLSAQGANATAADDSARLSAYDNVHDAGTYLEYDLNITATGLQGVQSGNEIVATNHATGVSGSFNGLFFFGGDGDGDIYTGYYVVDLDFDMQNWAYANNGSLNGAYHNGGDIYDSLFVAIQPVPEPATMSLLLMGLGGLVARRRRQHS